MHRVRALLTLSLFTLAVAACGEDAPTAPVETGSPAVDLVAHPVEAAAGAAVGGIVEYEVRLGNQGNLRAPAGWYVRVYLSGDAALDGGDQLIDQFAARRDLGPGGSDAYLRTFKVPGTVAPGEYHLVAELDATGVIAEPREDNNAAASPGRIPIVSVPDGDF